MKHIRNILLLITIIFAFVMQAEVYQNMLWNFNGAYYLSSRYTTTNDDMDSFLANAEDTAEKHGVHIFSTFNQRVSNYQTRLYIYGDDTVVRDSLKSTMDIEEKTYTALIGGITVIEFEDFREVKNTGNGQEIMISYIGDDDDIIATYQDLAKEYSISQPEFWQSTETDMMFIVWGLVAILMIVLNVIEVIRRQKEVVVRASLGENAAVLALKAVVADMISYAALFVLAKLLVSQFISGAYEDHLILAVYCAGAVLSVIPYAAFVCFDVKKAFANASDKKGMFYLLNGLKVFATAMTIFTITTNLSSIQGNLLTNTTLLENHYNDYYFGVMQLEPPFEENEEESTESKFWNDLYENEYNTINPVVCIGSRISDTDNYIFVNHNARDMLQGFSDMLTEDDEKEDIVVFVPKGRNAESYEDIAKEEIGSLTQNAEELRVVYKEYSGREQFYYLNSNREEAIDGLSRVTNPIVIYQANEAVALNGSYIETGTYNGEVIYGCDESTIRNAAKKYAEQLGSHYFMLTNVGEDYIYSHSFLVKLISFISSLCVLVLLLDIAIIVSEAKMEFRLSSMEISLKKVLGYSFYERHKRFISVNLIENIAVVILICIVSIFISNASVGIALLIGSLLTIIEMAIIFTNIMWVEKNKYLKVIEGRMFMIIIRGLNKAFGEKIIFSNFNLEIPDGSFVVISGDSGSGKSTLLNMIGGIEKPDSGSIIIEGLNITRLKNKNSFFADTVGFLFQNFALLENKTVKENLSLIKKSSRTKVSLKEALNRVGLSKEVNKKVYQLSGGEQQRVALARLMMKKCSVVLADEPTGSLDKKNRDIVMRLLHELNEEGKTVIIVTHDQGIIEDEPYVVKI